MPTPAAWCHGPAGEDCLSTRENVRPTGKPHSDLLLCPTLKFMFTTRVRGCLHGTLREQNVWHPPAGSSPTEATLPSYLHRANTKARPSPHPRHISWKLLSPADNSHPKGQEQGSKPAQVTECQSLDRQDATGDPALSSELGLARQPCRDMDRPDPAGHRLLCAQGKGQAWQAYTHKSITHDP